MVPPGPSGYIDGTSPYFFSTGQSAGPIRSKPLMPRRRGLAAASSSAMPRAKTPRVTPCLMRPLRFTGASSLSRDGRLCQGEGSGEGQEEVSAFHLVSRERRADSTLTGCG